MVDGIGWLSQLNEKYGSMVLYLKEKSQVDAMLARRFLEVRRESATMQAWEDRGKAEKNVSIVKNKDTSPAHARMWLYVRLPTVN